MSSPKECNTEKKVFKTYSQLKHSDFKDFVQSDKRGIRSLLNFK